METPVITNEQRKAEYKSATPNGYHPLAPTQGEYEITKVEVNYYKGKKAHLASATWRKNNQQPIVNTVTFNFYLECLFNDEAIFPANADINEMMGKTINVLSVVAYQRCDKTIISAIWKFIEKNMTNPLASYLKSQALTEDDLCAVIDQGLHLNSQNISWDDDNAEYDMAENDNVEFDEQEGL